MYKVIAVDVSQAVSFASLSRAELASCCEFSVEALDHQGTRRSLWYCISVLAMSSEGYSVAAARKWVVENKLRAVGTRVDNMDRDGHWI